MYLSLLLFPLFLSLALSLLLLRVAVSRLRRLQAAAVARRGALQGVGDWCTKTWNALAPLRIVVGLALLGLSLLVVVSFVMSAIDRALHSDCKFECGFTLTTPNVMNPIDKALGKLAEVRAAFLCGAGDAWCIAHKRGVAGVM